MSDQTDIERIAEKWDEDWRAEKIERQALSIHHYIKHALTEYAQLRDEETARLKEQVNKWYSSSGVFKEGLRCANLECDQLRAHLAEAEAQFKKAEEWNRLSQLECENLRSVVSDQDEDREKLLARQLALEAQCQRMRDALELTKKVAVVGMMQKDFWPQINEALSAPLDLELLNRVIKVLEMSHDRALDWDMLGRAHGNFAVQMWRESADALLKSLSPAP